MIGRQPRSPKMQSPSFIEQCLNQRQRMENICLFIKRHCSFQIPCECDINSIVKMM